MFFFIATSQNINIISIQYGQNMVTTRSLTTSIDYPLSQVLTLWNTFQQCLEYDPQLVWAPSSAIHGTRVNRLPSEGKGE